MMGLGSSHVYLQLQSVSHFSHFRFSPNSQLQSFPWVCPPRASSAPCVGTRSPEGQPKGGPVVCMAWVLEGRDRALMGPYTRM